MAVAMESPVGGHRAAAAPLLSGPRAGEPPKRACCSCSLTTRGGRAARTRVRVLRDQLELGPVSKWQRYRVFPLRLLLHVLACVAVTVTAVELAKVTNHSDTALSRRFYAAFLPGHADAADGADADLPFGATAFFTVNDTVAAAEAAVDAYWGMADNSIGEVEICCGAGSGGSGWTEGGGDDCCPTLQVLRWATPPAQMRDITRHWSGDTVSESYTLRCAPPPRAPPRDAR